MRRTEHLLKTMTALRHCIDDCRCNPNPLTALEKRIEQLRLHSEWTEAEIAEVEQAARRALQSTSLPMSTPADRESATVTAAAEQAGRTRCR